MRKPRFLLPVNFEFGVYHVISRVTDRRLILGDEEKDELTRLMKRYAEFAGIKVLTFCVMGNHFHWLVEVPGRPGAEKEPSDAELVARVRKCQGKKAAWVLEQALQDLLTNGHTALHAALRERWLARMWSLSAFVQSVKQRFSVWYNRRQGRKGTLWEERFKSVIAEGPQAVAVMAAYIDLNPVRAGLVADPKDYKWSGYGAAVAGDKAAEKGLRSALVGRRGAMVSKGEDVMAWYRSYIFRQGLERGVKADGKPMKKGFKVEQVEGALAVGGRLPEAEMLLKRVRYFSDGLVVGTKESLSTIFAAQRAFFSPKRRTGPRKMRGGEWGELSSMRDLRLDS